MDFGCVCLVGMECTCSCSCSRMNPSFLSNVVKILFQAILELFRVLHCIVLLLICNCISPFTIKLLCFADHGMQWCITY